ncbi:MAG TPA: helicase-related protein [Chloroflexota bacterium]|nr:helicase-related protein [Chloroflexota bacterium]
MTIGSIPLPQPDTVLTGPFWTGPVRVLRASTSGSSIRIEAVGVTDNQYYDRTLTAEQFESLVREELGGTFTFDSSPRLFRLATEAMRIHLAHSFDPQFAVSVSQVDPLPHQLDAVYKHLLPLPRIRFLLADDPGAGKTVMAGLLMRELIQRQEVRRVLVLCPKALTDQWRREMWERFRERFVLLTGEAISGAFGANAWLENDRVAASMDLALQDHILPGLEQATWDLVIFDEAHKLSAYRYGSAGKIEKTQRYQLAEKLASRTKHLLLMTATPHKGDDENFRLLMSLLDDKVFASRAGLRRALDGDRSPYFLRRMKESMRHFDGRPIFLPRHVDTVAYPLEAHEQQLYEAVTSYVATGLARAESTRNRNVGLALTILQRRLASSLFAIARSLERRRNRLSDELDRARSSGGRTLRESPAPYQVVEEDDDEAELTEEQEDALSAASNARTPEELAAEIRELDDLIERAHAAMNRGPEMKLREFQRVLQNELVAGQNEKILVFTEHRDTLTYLTQKLREWGYGVCTIHGGMKLQDRIAAEKEFRGPTQFMVATDAAGEGINLQFCRVMVNWDLPWNPNRLEQRMGRIHRYGQEYEVEVVNLVAESTREGAVLIRLMNKLQRMREALGHDQIYDVISGVLDSGQVRLDTLIRDAILNRRSLEAILADLDFVESESSFAAAREALGEALATANIDLAFINGELRESKERRLTPEYVERFFVDAFKHVGGRLTAGSDRDWRLDSVPADIRRTVAAYNTGEFGSEQRLITLRKERLRKDPPAEFVAPDHPLFDAVTERILTEGRSALARGTVFVDRDAREPYLLWLLEAAVVNGEGQRVHRRLVALRQRGGEFVPVSPGVLLDLPPADVAPSIPQALRASANADAAIAAASAAYAAEYLAEVTAEQQRQVDIVERALQQSAQDSLADLQAQLERQHEDQAKGKEMAIAIRTTNERIDALTSELRLRRAALERRKVTAIETAHPVGVAAVVPGPVPHAVEAGMGGDSTAVERAAMRVVMDYETRAGRNPKDVSKTGVGYDIRSEGADGEVRYIEVKGHASTGDVILYYTEWQTANRMRGEFFIYMVDQALSNPKLLVVQDPVGKRVQPLERVVEYQIRGETLRALAEEA